tara:strand:- start:101 stop:445 length:345 start_codon:yes stop_codon:yes gene_type:complete
VFYVNNIYYFLSISLLVIRRNTAAANIADTPLAPNEFAISVKFVATLVGNVPELSPKSKKRTNPAIAIANPNSDNFQINLLSDVIWTEYFFRIFSILPPSLYYALLFKFKTTKK